MKRITLFLFLILFSFSGFAQLTENFEGSTSPDLVSDTWQLGSGTWGVFDNGVGTGQSWTFNDTPPAPPAPPLVYEGARAAFMNRENIGAGNTAQDFLATPLTLVPANGQLKFWTRTTLNTNNGTLYKIMVAPSSAAQNDPGAYALIQLWNEDDLMEGNAFNEYIEKTVDLSAFAGTQVYIAFVMEFTQPTATIGGDRWLVDLVRVVEKCFDPTGLAAGSVSQTSATLSWTNPGGAANSEIYIVPITVTDEPTSGTVVPGNSYVATSTQPAGEPFTPSTQYQYWVRALCGTGPDYVASEWVGPFPFQTQSPGLTCGSAIPIVSLPYSTTDNTANYGDTTDATQGTNCGATGNYMTGNDVFYSYTATTTGAISIQMTPTATWSGIFVYEGCANVGVNCIAGIGNSNSNIREIPSLNVTAGQEYIIVISTNATPQTTGYTLVIQQLNCAAPTGLTAVGTGENAGIYTANLSWNAGVATSWEYVVQNVGSPIPSGAGITTTSNTNIEVNSITGGGNLALGQYQYWVRADCGDGTFSTWSGPYVFSTTTCAVGCTSNFILTDTFGDGWNGNTMNVTQNGVVVAVLSLATGNEATVPVSLCDGPFELFWNAGGNWAGEVGVSVVNSFGQTIYVKAPGTGTPNSLLFSGVVTCNEPTCLPPSNLTVTSPTLDSATFNWTPGGAETSWHVIALPNGSPAPTAATTGWTEVTTAPPFVLGGLEAGTAYDFYIRADCPGDPVSQWAGPLDFNTVVCAAADQCNYTFTLTDSFGDGWNGNTMTIFQGGVPVATIGSTFTTGAGPVTVTVPLCNGVAFDLVWNTGGSFAGEVGVSITSFLGESLFTHVPGTNLQGQTLYSGTGECVPPTCLKPTNVEVSNIGLNSVTVTWQDNNTPAATSWDVLVLPASAPAPTPASTGWVNVDENPYTINGLDAATLYKVYVRAVCSDTDSSFWSLGTQFGTLICLPSNLCEYTFVMVDTFGDSWNGNTMNVTQNGILVTTLTGPTNADDTNPVTVTVSLCNDVPFELFWNTGGSFAGEVGVSIVNQDGTTVFTHTPGTNLQGTQLFAGTVQCVPFTCPKPVQLAVSDVGETSATFNWVESGTATTWQILVIPAGSPIPTPGTPFTVEVTENPYTINNLDSGTAYVFYVRAVCADDDISNWSGPIPFNTLITNDECVNAIEVPVNPDQSCAQTVNGTLIGATASSQPNTCFGTDDDDVWFQFTATSSQHNITFSNFGGSTSDLMHVVYSGNCDGTLTQLVCSDPEQSVVTGLTPGETYLIRVYSWTGTPNQTSTFTICIGTIPPPIIVSQTDYTQVQLIQDVLLNSTCASASNITWSTGTNFGSTNGIGYFERNGADFPFENGIVLSTGNAAEAPGPNLDIQSNGNDAWPGDADLEAVLAAQGINDETNNATIFEFDFIPITNSISFRFVFASEEYGVFQCGFSDVFAFLLTDQNGVTTNLAVVPDTTTPVAVYTVRDQAYNNACASVNPEWFDTFYGLPAGENPLGAPVNFQGVTKPMIAQATVIPGQTYSIKMAIADVIDTAYDAAVFLEGGSFGVGNIDLGENLLIETNSAVCPGETTTLTTTLDEDLYDFQWYENGEILEGETTPTLTVDEPGTYTIEVVFTGTTCTASEDIIVEYYPEMVPGAAPDLYICSALSTGTFNLTENVDEITAPLMGPISLTYFLTQADAEANVNPITTPTAYTNTSNPQTIYVRVVNDETGCVTFTSFDLVLEDLTPEFDLTDDLTICQGQTATIAVTANNFDPLNATYTWTLDTNPLTENGSSIQVTQAGTYEVTVNVGGCTATQSMTVTVLTAPVLDEPADVTVCDSFVLPALTLGNYFTETNGGGTPLQAGDVIQATQTVYIFAANGECSAEVSFDITVNSITADDLPDAAACTEFMLPALSANNAYYTGPGGTGTSLNAGDLITSSQTIYVYAQTGTTPNCVSETSFEVSIGSIDAQEFADVTVCDSYTLEALPANHAYWSGPGATGTQYQPGQTISQSMTVYVYASVPGCFDESDFVVTVNATPVLDVYLDVTACDSYTLGTPTVGNYYSGPDGSGSILDGQTLTTSQTVYVYAQTGSTPNCFSQTSFSVTLTASPVVDDLADVSACDSYTLLPLTSGSYYTGSGGTGTSLNAGDVLTSSQTVYVYAQSGADCFDETSFEVTISSIPAYTVVGGCNGSQYVLSVSFADVTVDASQFSYDWSVIGSGSIVAPATGPEVVVSGAATYSVVVSQGGCEGAAATFEAVNTACKIQKGISANNDGENDYFDLVGQDVAKLQIFNRYGVKVYERSNYSNQWYGQSSDGEELPDGTYYYVIDYNVGQTKTGWIYINRKN